MKPPAFGDDGAPQAVADSAIEAAEALLAKYGPKPETYRLLGSAQMARGHYADAAAAFHAGSKLSPDFSADVSRAEAALNVAREFEMKVPGRTVIHAKRLSRQGRDVWVVVHGRTSSATAVNVSNPLPTSIPNDDPFMIDDPRLTVWADGKATYTSPTMTRGDFDDSSINEISLYIADLDGNGTEEAVVSSVFYGASWTPSALLVVSQSGGKWTTLKPIRTHEPGWIQDIDRDGHVELGGVNVVGREMSHSAQPRWPEIYRFDKGNIKRCDSRFPARYGDMGREMPPLSKEYPNDFEILAYRGRLARILGRMSEARRFEVQALAALARARRSDKDIPASMAGRIQVIVRRDEIKP